ncbi:MAG: hypothetical protein M0P13_00805 [Fibrobacteraceae bacterium]|nr:hypothetical protein [Fibrobacteraceae bacterium]
MNLENLDVLSQKVESVLDSLRRMKNEKSLVEKEFFEFKNRSAADLIAKDEQIKKLNGERNLEIENLKSSVEQKNSEIESANAVIADKDADIEKLNGFVASKNSEIESLRGMIAEKDARLAEMEKAVNEQGSEIQAAQEKFKKLLSTIETELGTQLPIAEKVEDNAIEQPAGSTSKVEAAQNDFFA